MQGLASLDLFDFGVLLQALATSLKVGVLAVRSGDRAKYLHIDRTRIQAIYARRPRVSLEKVLWNYRSIEKPALREALDELERRPEKGPLGKFLLSTGQVTQSQLRQAHVYQVIEEVLEVFYWKNVGFEFYAGTNAREILRDPLLAEIGEPVETDNVLLVCTKTIDDIAKFNEVTPSLRDVYELHIGSLGSLEDAVPEAIEREFLLLIDGVRDMREVLRDMRLNRFDALECFYKFRTKGWLRPKNAFELLMLAENRRREFTLEKRARVLERVNELGVEGFQVLLPLAETYEESGASDKAAKLYAQHARKCLAAADADNAVKAAARARSLQPQDTELRAFEIEVLGSCGRRIEAAAGLRSLGELLAASGDAAAARLQLRRAVRLAPEEAAAWTALADVEERLGARRRAARCLRRASVAFEAAGAPDDAVAALRRARPLCPRAWSIGYRLADLLHATGRRDEAVEELARVVALVAGHDGPPEHHRAAHLTKVEEKLRTSGGLASSAVLALGRAWADVGESGRASIVLREAAEGLTRAGRHRSAVQILDQLLEVEPSNHDARRLLARAHSAAGDGDRALAHLRRLALALMNASDFEGARATYEEMLRVDPACPDAHRGLARALLYLGRSDEASDHYHRVGLIYRGYGRPGEAVPYLREAVDRRPSDTLLLEEYCELLMSVGDRRDELLQALSALVELHMASGAHARAAIALSRILEIDQRYPGAKDILQEAAKQLLRLAESSEEISAEDARRLVAAARAARE